MDQLNFQFWQLARWHRQQLTGRVIAVAGGPGKSTTQQMIDVVLRGRFSGRASCSDSNEPWALPLELLELQRQDAYGVLEYREFGKTRNSVLFALVPTRDWSY